MEAVDQDQEVARGVGAVQEVGAAQGPAQDLARVQGLEIMERTISRQLAIIKKLSLKN